MVFWENPRFAQAFRIYSNKRIAETVSVNENSLVKSAVSILFHSDKTLSISIIHIFAVFPPWGEYGAFLLYLYCISLVQEVTWHSLKSRKRGTRHLLIFCRPLSTCFESFLRSVTLKTIQIYTDLYLTHK